MVSSTDVYSTVLSLVKKDRRGRAFNIDEYNSIAKLVNIELYNFYVARYETDATVSDILSPFKVRDVSISLLLGKGTFPGFMDRLAGNPKIMFPWGAVNKTEKVEIVGGTVDKVRVTSIAHGLKDGDIITVSGISIHIIVDEPIHFIDRDSFWVDVDFAGTDILTNARWKLVTSWYRSVDMVTEMELSARIDDALKMPTVHNPVAVVDGNIAGLETISSQITVYPPTIPSVIINYLKVPATPFLDYYVNNTTLGITYMVENAPLLHPAAGLTSRLGIASNGVVDFPSVTANWQWSETMLPQIVYAILEKAGVNMENMNITNISMQKAAKEESQI